MKRGTRRATLPPGDCLALEWKVRKNGSVLVIGLKGKITLGEASQSIRTHVEQFIAENCPQVVFNLAEVPFVDSAGLGALTLSFTKLKAAGGCLKLVTPQPRVQDALEMTRLTRLFPLFPSDDEAAESFSATPSCSPPAFQNEPQGP